MPIDEIQAQGEDSGRPHAAIPGFEALSRLRPGLTGTAQIFAPKDVPRRQKYQYEAIYANHQSLWLDIGLILLSLWIALRARSGSRKCKI